MADTTVSTNTADSAQGILTSLLEPTELATSTESADPAAAAAPGAPPDSTEPAATSEPDTSTALETTTAPDATTKPASPKAHKEKNDDEKAINKCMRAWNYAYRKVLPTLDEDQSDWQAEKAGNAAYLSNIPPLVGYENICNFIACINYASLIKIISTKEAAHFMANARIALSTIYHQPTPSSNGARPVGRPRKVAQPDPPQREEMK